MTTFNCYNFPYLYLMVIREAMLPKTSVWSFSSIRKLMFCLNTNKILKTLRNTIHVRACHYWIVLSSVSKLNSFLVSRKLIHKLKYLKFSSYPLRLINSTSLSPFPEDSVSCFLTNSAMQQRSANQPVVRIRPKNRSPTNRRFARDTSGKTLGRDVWSPVKR